MLTTCILAVTSIWSHAVCLLVNRWSTVGLQGALLSHLVEPLYLHSLTVGTLSHTGHLGRAMARRLAPIRHLPFPYRRQQLLLGCRSRCGSSPETFITNKVSPILLSVHEFHVSVRNRLMSCFPTCLSAQVSAAATSGRQEKHPTSA